MSWPEAVRWRKFCVKKKSRYIEAVMQSPTAIKAYLEYGVHLRIGAFDFMRND